MLQFRLQIITTKHRQLRSSRYLRQHYLTGNQALSAVIALSALRMI